MPKMSNLITPEQRKALRKTGYVEIRNEDHTVCFKLAELLDALDAAELLTITYRCHAKNAEVERDALRAENNQLKAENKKLHELLETAEETINKLSEEVEKVKETNKTSSDPIEDVLVKYPYIVFSDNGLLLSHDRMVRRLGVYIEDSTLARSLFTKDAKLPEIGRRRNPNGDMDIYREWIAPEGSGKKNLLIVHNESALATSVVCASVPDLALI